MLGAGREDERDARCRLPLQVGHVLQLRRRPRLESSVTPVEGAPLGLRSAAMAAKRRGGEVSSAAMILRNVATNSNVAESALVVEIPL